MTKCLFLFPLPLQLVKHLIISVEPELNQRPMDNNATLLQSTALPTELPTVYTVKENGHFKMLLKTNIRTKRLM